MCNSAPIANLIRLRCSREWNVQGALLRWKNEMRFQNNIIYSSEDTFDAASKRWKKPQSHYFVRWRWIIFYSICFDYSNHDLLSDSAILIDIGSSLFIITNGWFIPGEYSSVKLLYLWNSSFKGANFAYTFSRWLRFSHQLSYMFTVVCNITLE